MSAQLKRGHWAARVVQDMRTTSDIREVAKLLIEHGNKSRFDANYLPAYQEAIRKTLKCSSDAFVDELGFVNDKDARGCYLEQPIDFAWLANHISLEKTLVAKPEKNCIYDVDNYMVIEGGEQPASNRKHRVLRLKDLI